MSQRRAKPTKKQAAVSENAADNVRLLRDQSVSSEARCAAGEALMAGGQEAHLRECHPLNFDVADDSATVQARGMRLIAFAAAHAGDLISAEQAIGRALALYPDALDLMYLSAFIAVSFHEHHQALEIIQKFRAVFQDGQVIAPQIPNAFLSSAHLSQLANMAGVAQRALGKADQAEIEFRQAIEYDRTQQLAWLNLLHLLAGQERADECAAIAREAQQACPGVPEFAQYLRMSDTKLSLAVCMMVKNEEELLAGALESVREIASEIIVVDTGSTDRTKEIATQFGARIIDEPWAGNFSKHRNTSIAAATADWILILDADERLEQNDLAALHSILRATDHRVISINVFNLYGKKRESHNFLPSVRLFRRSLGLCYEGIVHNVLKVPATEPVLRTNTRLWHLGYDLSPEKMAKKFERSKALLEAQLRENPDNAFAHFNYAQLLRGAEIDIQLERSGTIIAAAKRAVELTETHLDKFRHIHLMALNQLAWAYFVNGELGAAHQFTDRALALKPDYLDPLMLRGHLFSKAEEFDRAIAAYETFLSVQAAYRPETENDDIIVANVSNRAAAYYGIALANHARGRNAEAMQFYRKTLQENSEYHEANQFLGILEHEAGNDEVAIRHLEAQMQSDQPTVHAAVAIASIFQERRAYVPATQYAQAAVRLDPTSATAQALLIQLLVESGRSLELPAAIEQALANGIPRSLLAIAEARGWMSSGDFERAVELFSSVALSDLLPADSVMLADALFRQGAFDRSAEAYQRAITAGADDLTLLRNYGVALARAGQSHQAATTLRRYVDQPGADPMLWETVGDLYSKVSEYELAKDAYEAGIRLAGVTKRGLFGLASAYESLGQLRAAEAGFRQLVRQYPADPIIAARLTILQAKCSQTEQIA